MKHQTKHGAAILLAGVLTITSWGIAHAQPVNNPESIKKEIQMLKNRLAQLESQLSQAENNMPASPPPRAEAWSPYEEIQQLQREMNRMFNNSFWRGAGTVDPSLWRQSSFFDPQLDIKQLPKEYLFQMDVPGMDKSNIKVETENNKLTISGEKKSDTEEKTPNQYYRQERSFGYFSRTVPLPADAKTEGIQAEYKNGVLLIHIPRVAVTTPVPAKTTIDIK